MLVYAKAVPVLRIFNIWHWQRMSRQDRTRYSTEVQPRYFQFLIFLIGYFLSCLKLFQQVSFQFLTNILYQDTAIDYMWLNISLSACMAVRSAAQAQLQRLQYASGFWPMCSTKFVVHGLQFYAKAAFTISFSFT